MEGLRSSEQQAQEIVDAIQQTIAVLSSDGQPIYGNRSLLQYTGLTIAEMTSADFRARVFHPEDVARLREQRHDALARDVPFEKERIWVLLTEAPDGGWGLAGHAHTNAELVAAARAQLGKK